MCDVTLICCYNNDKSYGDFVKTLVTQTIPYELIGIDNRSNKRFSSCAAAYNSVIDMVKTKYVVYTHQDIILTEPDNLEKFVSCLGRIGASDILGVAGVKFDVANIYTDLKQIFKATGKFTYAGGLRVEGGLMECDVIDECFFGGRTEYFSSNQFDEVLCDGWHLYAVEQCLRTKSAIHASSCAEGGGGQVYVSGIGLVHLSDGTLHLKKSKLIVYPSAFYYTFFKLCRKYSANFPFIRTTCACSRTDLFHALKQYIRLIIKYCLAHLGL